VETFPLVKNPCNVNNSLMQQYFLPRVPSAMSANFWNDSRNAEVQAAVVLHTSFIHLMTHYRYATGVLITITNSQNMWQILVKHKLITRKLCYSKDDRAIRAVLDRDHDRDLS